MSISLSKSICSTLSYHSRFSYPLTFGELHRFLIINRPLSSNEVKSELAALIKQKKIRNDREFYYLSNSPALPASRRRRRRSSQPKIRLARRLARLIGFIPWVKLVCLTGALAMENSDPDDDIDLMVVASQNRLWLARPLVVLLASLFFKRRLPREALAKRGRRPKFPQLSKFPNEICLNLWLDESALKMPPGRQNCRTARELAQMRPLFDRDFTYQKMLRQNCWGSKYLANFWKSRSAVPPSRRPAVPPSRRLLNGIINWLNFFFFRLQLWYMDRRRTTEKVGLHSAWFHPAP